MKPVICKYVLLLGLAAVAWLGSGVIGTTPHGGLIGTAEARIGLSATPISYAGVARRTTGRTARPGAGVSGIGGPASGVGVLPGAGVGHAGVGYSGGRGVNLGGPANRAGVR
jgi:hypothetical protein